jgi:hypothetical protein
MLRMSRYQQKLCAMNMTTISIKWKQWNKKKTDTTKGWNSQTMHDTTVERIDQTKSKNNKNIDLSNCFLADRKYGVVF